MIERLREVLVGLQGLALPVEIWERDVLPRRTGAYSQTWLDSLCASGEVVWVGAGPLGRSGRVALYFREDAPAIGPPARSPSARPSASPPANPEHELLRAQLAQGPCFFTDLLAELSASAEALRVALWDLVWAGEVTNDAWAPLRAPHLALASSPRSSDARSVPAGRRVGRPTLGHSRLGARRLRARGTEIGQQLQGRWSLTEPVFAGASSDSSERRRTLAELLLERYGIVTREQVLAEGMRGGFATLYETFSNLETLGVCRRGYFIEGMGAAQFALPGAVERLRAARSAGHEQAGEEQRALVIAAADPAQPYGGALPWPKRERLQGRPARVAGAYVVMVAERADAVRGARGPWAVDAHGGSRAQRRDRFLERGARSRAAVPGPGGAGRGACAPGGWASWRSSASTASPRSPPGSHRCSSSWASTPVRAGSRSPPEAPRRSSWRSRRRSAGDALRSWAMPFTCVMQATRTSPTRPRRVGHKGAAHIEPGNTLASFDAALAHGVDMIELDVLSEHPDGSGRLLVAHDFEDMRARTPLSFERALEHLAGEAFAEHRARRRREAAGL